MKQVKGEALQDKWRLEYCYNRMCCDQILTMTGSEQPLLACAVIQSNVQEILENQMNQTCVNHASLVSFLTLLCEDTSLHKTSRQANKFVYLHIFSGVKCLGVKLRNPKRQSLYSVQKVK